MTMLRLPLVLRVASILVLAAVAIRFALVGSLLVPPFVTVAVFLLLSFTCERWPVFSALVTLVPGVLVPVMVSFAYRNGNIELPIVIFDWVLFLWVDASAVRTLVLSRNRPAGTRPPG